MTQMNAIPNTELDSKDPELLHYDSVHLTRIRAGLEDPATHLFPATVPHSNEALISELWSGAPDPDGKFECVGKASPRECGSISFEFFVDAAFQMLSMLVLTHGLTGSKDGYDFQIAEHPSRQELDTIESLPAGTSLYLRCKPCTFRTHPHTSISGDIEIFIEDRGVGILENFEVFLQRKKSFSDFLKHPKLPEYFDAFFESPMLPNARTLPCHDGWDHLRILNWSLGNIGESWHVDFDKWGGERHGIAPPAPPILFISRIVSAEGIDPVATKPGGVLNAEYCPTAHPWYGENDNFDALPLSVFLEISLQPTAWIARIKGMDQFFQESTFTRNLDVSCKLFKPLTRNIQAFRTKIHLTGVSHLSNVGLSTFKIDILDQDDEPLGEIKTSFGSFTRRDLEKQAGFPKAEYPTLNPTFEPISLKTSEAKNPLGNPLLAKNKLLMLDRIVDCQESPDGSSALICSETDILPSNWYFKSHFFRDPVMPGSFGVEAAMQILKWFAGSKGLGGATAISGYEIPPDRELTIKYRGQILPHTRRMRLVARIKHNFNDSDVREPIISGDFDLFADNTCIYKFANLGLRLLKR